jgi:hypothetical protein
MNVIHTTRRVIAAALLSGSVAVAGLGLAAATAQAQPGVTPQVHIPYATDNFSQPHQWCPGQPLPADDVHWDTNICHTWFWVAVGGMGNVGQFVWDSATPPPHGPPPCYGAPICLPGL